MTDFRRKLGVALRQARVNAQLTQGQLATAIGVTRPSVTNIEAGRQAVDSETLLAIADATVTDPARLLADARGTRPPPPTAERAERDRLLTLLAAHTCQHPGCSCPSAVAGRDALRRIAELNGHLDRPDRSSDP